jgi:hypothetical protein
MTCQFEKIRLSPVTNDVTEESGFLTARTVFFGEAHLLFDSTTRQLSLIILQDRSISPDKGLDPAYLWDGTKSGMYRTVFWLFLDRLYSVNQPEMSHIRSSSGIPLYDVDRSPVAPSPRQ